MRRATVVAAILALWALAPAVTRADTAAPAPRELTMEQALAMAKRANKNLVVERARLAAAHTNIEQAWAALFPVVTAQGRYTRNYKNATLDFGALLNGLGYKPTVPPTTSFDVTILKQDQFDANVSATMPLIAPAAYPALDAVKKGYGSSEADYEASEDTVLYSVAQTFYAAAVSDEVLLVRDSAINVAQATLDNAQSRFSAGTVTKVDVDRAELALVRAKQGELDARYAREQSYRALATLIQADGPLKAVPPERLPPPGETRSRPGASPAAGVPERHPLAGSFRCAAARPRLAVGAHVLGLRQGEHRQLRRLHRRQLRLVGGGAARLDIVRRRHPGRAAPPGGRAGGAGGRAGRRAHRLHPRRSGQQPQPARDQARGDQGCPAGRRSGGGDARPDPLAVRGGDRDPD